MNCKLQWYGLFDTALTYARGYLNNWKQRLNANNTFSSWESHLQSGKCHFVCLGRNTESAVLYFSDQTYTNRKEETLLGIIINNKLSFYGQIKGLCKKTPQKLSALSKITPYLDSSQKITIFKSIIKSQFIYCSLVWMFCSTTSNNTINKIQEPALRIILANNIESFV